MAKIVLDDSSTLVNPLAKIEPSGEIITLEEIQNTTSLNITGDWDID